MMKVFITGVTSFLGKSFFPKLLTILNTNDEIFILVRKELKIKDNRVKQLVGDLREIENFKKELLDSNYIFHIAANAVFKGDDDYFETNFIPTQKMVDVVKDSLNLKNFIYVSSIGAVDRHKSDRCGNPININNTPNPRSNYGKSKLKSERYIINSRIPYTIIRPSWIYGKDMRSNSHINQFVNMVLNKSPLIKFNFPGKVSIIFVDDLSNALINAINNNKIINKTYFAATENISIGQIFKLIYKKIYNEDLNQINLPNLNFLFSRIHFFIPILISNLFIDYLCAHDEMFWEDFNIKNKINIEIGIEEVIKSNVKKNGAYIITGANSGIGFSLAKLLNSQGKRLILIDKNIENLKFFKNQKIIKCDLYDFIENPDLLDDLIEEKIYCLINNAGIGLKGNFEKLKEEDIKKIVYVNALVPVMLTKKLINNLIKNEGVIVNITSNIAFNPLPGMSLYSATKAFLDNWSASITYELRKSISVITFAPSGTYTNFQQSCGVKILNEGRGLLSPEVVAKKIVSSIENKKRFVVVGAVTKIFLLVSKLLPRNLNIKLWGKLFEKLR